MKYLEITGHVHEAQVVVYGKSMATFLIVLVVASLKVCVWAGIVGLAVLVNEAASVIQLA